MIMSQEVELLKAQSEFDALCNEVSRLVRDAPQPRRVEHPSEGNVIAMPQVQGYLLQCYSAPPDLHPGVVAQLNIERVQCLLIGPTNIMADTGH